MADADGADTDDDGRIKALAPDLVAGIYRIRFDTRAEGRYSEAADGQWLHEGSDDDEGWEPLP